MRIEAVCILYDIPHYQAEKTAHKRSKDLTKYTEHALTRCANSYEGNLVALAPTIASTNLFTYGD